MTDAEELVAKFWELHGELGTYAKAWSAAKTWFEERARARGKDPGQTWRNTSGAAFEAIGKELIVQQVTKSQLAPRIRIWRWSEVPEYIKSGVLSELVWPKGQIRKSAVAESNVDLVAAALENDAPTNVISVYSCKSSARERYQQDLFWAEKIRGRGIKFCFVTIDPHFEKYATTSTQKRAPRKAVVLSQALYDRIYLLTHANIVRGRAVFRHMDAIVADLDLWLKAY